MDLLTSVLFPDNPDVIIEDVTIEDHVLIFSLRSTRLCAECPVCACSSTKVHGSYVRKPADLPCLTSSVRLHLHVRRFLCQNTQRERKTFAESFAGLVVAYAQRTLRQPHVLRELAFSLGGKPGAHMAATLACQVSRDTLLRLLRRTPLPPTPVPQVLGIDDWAWRRGHTYGTILIELQRHQPVDLLPDREAEILANWLREHPGVQIASRDRGGNYAEGLREGAPGAIQVADRFHLLKNLGDAVQKLLTRHLLAFRRKPATKVSQEGNQKQKAGPPIKQPLKVTPELAAIRVVREEERLARYEQVITLREQGWSHQAIADRLGMGSSTVQSWLAAGHFPKRKSRQQSSKLDRFLPYLQQRRAQGCFNMVQLHQEIRERGYQGSYEAMRHILLRVFPKEQKWQRIPSEKDVQPHVALSPREAMWLFLRRPEKLTAKEQHSLEHLCQIHEEVALAYQLVQQFAEMLRTRSGGQLDAWLDAVLATSLADLHSFAKGIKSDIEAVEAGLILPWSNGMVEGQVNRLKLIKRQMYGRAHFDLLRLRVLHHDVSSHTKCA
nr:ISL3 family transposase [Dictyobacter alpinus]